MIILDLMLIILLIVTTILLSGAKTMLLFDLMIIALLMVAVILLSGVKLIVNHKYTQLVISIILIYNLNVDIIEGYKLGYTGIGSIIIVNVIILLIAIWGYKRNNYTYYIHNVKEDDIKNIIGKYLERKNINYKVMSDEIYLPDINKYISIEGLMEKTLNCKEIKDTEFYNDLVSEVKSEIKEIKQRHFSIEGVFYLIITLFVYWIRVTFF